MAKPTSAEDKALVNYWYRHVWECVCPIYASVILCADALAGATHASALFVETPGVLPPLMDL